MKITGENNVFSFPVPLKQNNSHSKTMWFGFERMVVKNMTLSQINFDISTALI